MAHRLSRTLITTSSAIILALSTAACAQEGAKTADPQTPKTLSAQPVEATPVATNANDQQSAAQSTPIEQAHNEHDGHNHGAPAGEPRDLSNVTHVLDRAPDDHFYGNLDAPNTVIIYASVTCPHCSDWFTNDWPKFKAQQVDTGNTLVVFREIATPPQQIAAYGFVIADCAPKDQYMDHIVYQMQQQKQIFEKLQAGQGKEVYDDLAARAGLDTEAKLKACFDEQSHIERLNTSSMRLEATGPSGVPAFVINGELFSDRDTSTDNLVKFMTSGGE